MKKVMYRTIVFLCLLLAIIPEPSRSQNKRTGTAAAPELLIPVGARDVAMGGSTIATSSGTEAIHWNPAGLGKLESGAEGMFSSMSYIGDISVNYGAVGARFGTFGNLALNIKSLSFGDIPMTTQDDPEGASGRIFSPTFVTVGFTYARQISEAISFGGTGKLITEQIAQVSATGFAFDVGVQYGGLVGVSGLMLGVTVKNIGSQMAYDGPGLYQLAQPTQGDRPEQRLKSEAAGFELPSLVEIGLAFKQQTGENFMWVVNSSFTNNNLYLDEYRVGGELGYFMKDVQLFGRAGIGMVPEAKGDDGIFGASLGFGIAYKTGGANLGLDYAYRQAEFFDGNNVISLKFGF